MISPKSMVATKTQRPIRIYVLTSTKTQYLLEGFDKRFQEHWGAPYEVYISDTPLHEWSDGVINFLQGIDDEYLILLHEDFYLTKDVKREKIQQLSDYAIAHKVDRASLLGNHTPLRTYRERQYWRYNIVAEYQFSFEASIQKRTFLLEHLRTGRDPWKAETEAKVTGAYIIATEEPLIFYQDALRRGVDQNVI